MADLCSDGVGSIIDDQCIGALLVDLRPRPAGWSVASCPNDRGTVSAPRLRADAAAMTSPVQPAAIAVRRPPVHQDDLGPCWQQPRRFSWTPAPAQSYLSGWCAGRAATATREPLGVRCILAATVYEAGQTAAIAHRRSSPLGSPCGAAVVTPASTHGVAQRHLTRSGR